MQKRPKRLNIALFSETIGHKNLKLATVVVCKNDFSKMYTMITFCKGQRSSGAIIHTKLDFFAENALFKLL